jgi:hypothetical protein
LPADGITPKPAENEEPAMPAPKPNILGPA